MTRFARSDGSKGSNKREEEEATPWSVLVQQMKNTTAGDIEDVDDGYGEMEEDEEVEKSRENILSKADELLGSESEDEEEGQDLDTSLLDQFDDEQVEKRNLKRPLTLISQELVSSDQPKKKKRKKSEKCKVCGEKGHWKKDCDKLPAERRQELNELLQMKVDRKGKGTGRKKNKNKLAQILADNQEGREEDTGNDGKLSSADDNKKNKNKSRGPGQGRGQGNKEVKDRSGAVIEEGEALFQGFRVTKEDQLRLKKLHKKLKSSGATKQEVDEALKRERRRAEKSLARNKKLVCFNCREPGHVLAECPNTENIKVEDMPAAAGHCFKCGSLEHSSKDCKSKLKRENAYRFAVCFICKQEGHLAKACPDNPKGLYPNGGGCVFCGSVEHLKRDCPRKVEKDMRQGVKVGLMGGVGLEEEEPHVSAFRMKKNKLMNKPKKVVAF